MNDLASTYRTSFIRNKRTLGIWKVLTQSFDELLSQILVTVCFATNVNRQLVCSSTRVRPKSYKKFLDKLHENYLQNNKNII